MTGWPPDVIERQPARVMVRLEAFWHGYVSEMQRAKAGMISPYFGG